MNFELIDKITNVLNRKKSLGVRLEITKELGVTCKNLETYLYDLIILNISEQKDFLTVFSTAREATSLNKNTPIVVVGLSEKFLKLGKSDSLVYCTHVGKGPNDILGIISDVLRI